MSVIEWALRKPYQASMLTPEQIRDELCRQLDDRRIRAVDVARLLNLAPPRISEIRIDKRKIAAEEMEPLARFLGMTDTPAPPPVPTEEVLLATVRALAPLWTKELQTEAGREALRETVQRVVRLLDSQPAIRSDLARLEGAVLAIVSEQFAPATK